MGLTSLQVCLGLQPNLEVSSTQVNYLSCLQINFIISISIDCFPIKERSKPYWSQFAI